MFCKLLFDALSGDEISKRFYSFSGTKLVRGLSLLKDEIGERFDSCFA